MRPHWATLTILAVALWLFTTAGGSQVFVSDMLGEAYDSQAEHFLRGDVDVDGQAIRHEAMIVNGKARIRGVSQGWGYHGFPNMRHCHRAGSRFDLCQHLNNDLMADGV